MGPILLLDKSSLQKLSKDEIWKLFKHYTLVISPILILEILADLSKKGLDADRATKFVSSLADKLCPGDCNISSNFRNMAVGSLMGYSVPMTGQIVLDGGDIIEDEKGEKGVFFDEAPEWKYIRKWQRGDFTVDDVGFAKKWRSRISLFDLEAHREYLDKILPSKRPKVSQMCDVAILVDGLIENSEDQYDKVLGFMQFLGISASIRQKICWRWEMGGFKKFNIFAPYAFFCFRVQMLFNFGLHFRLLNTKASNIIDLEYLLYAPFCMVFSSGDKFHKALAPLILRSDQSFVDDDVLKSDMIWLMRECSYWSAAERSSRATHFGHYPPICEDSITYQLWKKYMLPWTPNSGNIKMSGKEKKKLVNDILSKVKRWEDYKKQRVRK